MKGRTSAFEAAERQHVATLPGAEVIVTLEVEVRVPGGIPDDLVRTIAENCGTLKLRSSGFEEG